VAETNLRSSIGLRIIIILVLSFVLLIPSVLIQELIKERQSRRDQASEEVSSKWGNQQTVVGPILSIPYQDHIKSKVEDSIIRYVHFLPEDLSISGTIYPEIRYRGIYEVVLFRTQLKLNGNFNFPDFKGLNILETNVIWKEAFLTIGISDMKGINDPIIMKWNGQEFNTNPGVRMSDIISSGVFTKLSINPNIENFEFSSVIDINGSTSLQFIPIGKESNLKIISDWKNPSFIGGFLPDVRNVGSDGFQAEWKILHLNRNYPQQWIDKQYEMDSSTFGVDLLLPVDEYQKNMRTAKYAIMFIVLTFLSFFMIELLNKKVIHPVQYILIGSALILFYTLLLSISEYLSFNFAYLISSLTIIFTITIYSKSVLSNKLHTVTIAGILIVLYGYLYIILQLQDFALLMGSLGLFFILIIVMFLTRKIDWFSVMKTEHGKFAS